MTTINDVSDLARILREQPEWVDTLRSLLLSQELLDLPERFADLVKLTDANFQLVNQRLENLETNVAELKAEVKQTNSRLDRIETEVKQTNNRLDRIETEVRQTNSRVDRIETEIKQINGRLDNGFGFSYELKTEKNIRSIAGQFLNLRSVQTLRGAQSNQDNELAERTEQAAAEGRITWTENAELWEADLIFTGRGRNETGVEYVVAEVSITAGDADVNRAARRAEILSAVLGRPVQPAVIAAQVDAARGQLAREKGVALIQAPT